MGQGGRREDAMLKYVGAAIIYRVKRSIEFLAVERLYLVSWSIFLLHYPRPSWSTICRKCGVLARRYTALKKTCGPGPVAQAVSQHMYCKPLFPRAYHGESKRVLLSATRACHTSTQITARLMSWTNIHHTESLRAPRPIALVT